jgi:hypothetical protein
LTFAGVPSERGSHAMLRRMHAGMKTPLDHAALAR